MELNNFAKFSVENFCEEHLEDVFKLIRIKSYTLATKTFIEVLKARMILIKMKIM